MALFDYSRRMTEPEKSSPDVTAEQQRRLPEGTEGEVRMVRIGDYDDCPCIGLHVEHTAQIGTFVLLGTNWDEEKHSFRIRFKLEGADSGTWG